MLAVGTRIDPPVIDTFNTGGDTGTAVVFPVEMPSANYHVSVEIAANPSGGLGEVWTSGKLTTGCTIHNSGSIGLAGTYLVTAY